MLELKITVPADATIEQVAREAQRRWLAIHVQPGDSQIGLSKRLGMTYRELRYLLRKLSTTVADLVALATPPESEDNSLVLYTEIPEDSACQFCSSHIDVHLHHVVNRHDSPVTVALCAICHRKFHFLNKLYSLPKRHKPPATSSTSTPVH